MNEPEYESRTTLERLVAANLLSNFDDAAKLKNLEVMVQLLANVGIGQEEALRIAQEVLRDPSKFGYY